MFTAFKDKFFKDSMVNIAGTVLSGIFMYAFYFLISRKMSVGQYGELQTLFSVASIFGVFGTALNNFVIKYSSAFAAANDPFSSRQFIGLMVKKIGKLSFILFGSFLVIVPFLFWYLHMSDMWGLIMVGVAVIITMPYMVYLGTLLGWRKFFPATTINTVGSILKLAVGFLIVIFFPAASVVIFSLLLASIVVWAALIFYCRKKFPVSAAPLAAKEDWQKKYFSWEDIKKSAAPVFIFSTLTILVSNIDILLVKNLTTPEITGYYAALSILGKIILWVSLAVTGVVLPAACATGHDGKAVGKKILWGAYGLILLMGGSAIALYAFFPKFIVGLLFGSRYTAFSGDLWMFGVMALVLSLLLLESNLAYGRHDFKISYILGAVVVLMAISIHFFHENIGQIVLGVISSFAIGYVIALVLNLIHRKRQLIESCPVLPTAN